MTGTAPSSESMPDAFYRADGDTFVATALTRGPWDARLQHGGPPSALLVRAFERYEGGDAFAVVRFTVHYLRAVPIGAVTIDVEPVHLGRTSQRLAATLSVDGRAVMQAQAMRVLRRPLDLPPSPDAEAGTDTGDAAWPDPEALEPVGLSFFPFDVAYHRAVDVRFATGAWGDRAVRVWARTTVPLVAGETTSPRQQTAVLTDAQSGIAVPLSPFAFGFPNPEMTVAFARTPVGPWLGMDIRSTAGPDGVGFAQSRLVDADGDVGGASQTVIITPHKPRG